MRILLAALVSVLFFTACEFQQDPLAKAPSNVQGNTPPTTEKPLPEKPIDKEGLQIDAPTKINGRVGAPIEFKIEGRVMIEDVPFELSIDNLKDFEGATYDPTTGIFKWTPTKAFIGSQPSMEGYLRITLHTVPTDKLPKISVERKEITFVITNTYTKPIVMNVMTAGNYGAGSNHDIEVTVEDIDAYNASEVKLAPYDCSDYWMKSANQFAYVEKFVATALPNQYKTTVKLQLSGVDLTSGKYCLGYVAVSKHGVPSEPVKKEFGISGLPKDTRLTINPIIQITAGTSFQKTFSIYDPSSNGTVTLASVDDLGSKLPGSSLTCAEGPYRNQLDCVLTVVTAADTPTKEVRIKLTTQSTVPGVSFKANTVHDFRISVKAAN